MRIYWIDAPSVSSGLKRTYHKKLEVYSGTTSEDGKWADSDTLYRVLRGKWCDKAHKGSTFRLPYMYRQDKRNIEAHETMPTLQEMNAGCAYATLEMAQAAKMILIQHMTKTYEAELVRLRELLKKNVPDIEKPLAVLKEDYPEYFI